MKGLQDGQAAILMSSGTWFIFHAGKRGASTQHTDHRSTELFQLQGGCRVNSDVYGFENTVGLYDCSVRSKHVAQFDIT